MANLVARSGRVNIRVGGNTQETAVMVQNTTNGQLLEKDKTNTLGTVSLPFGRLLSINESIRQNLQLSITRRIYCIY